MGLELENPLIFEDGKSKDNLANMMIILNF